MSIRSKNWLKFGALMALAFVLGLFFAGLLDFPRTGLAQERSGTHVPIVRVDAPRIPSARPLVELSDAYAAVVDAVRPSVVYIESDRPVTQSEEQSQIFGQLPPGFQQQVVPRGQSRRQQKSPDAPQELEHGSGSGFIVSSDGYILTNNHVIEGSTGVRVRLLDGRQFDATIVGTDKDTDIGVLKINTTGLTPSALGSSDGTRVGEWVLAIGNPLGQDLTFTVTQGIVSAKGRPVRDLDNDGGKVIHDFIQTDAVINRGNSGGPLVNARGEVIGINSAIASTNGGYSSGYAFAIPIDLARKVMDQIIQRGRVERAGMGIQIVEVSREDADYLSLPSIAGARVARMGAADDDASSPAAQAGIKVGDVIVAIDGQPVNYVAQLQQNVGFRRPGDVVKVDVYRKDGKHSYNVKLTSILTNDDATVRTTAKKETGASSAAASMGLVVEPVTATNAAQYGLPATTKGLVIASVIDGTPAADKSLCSLDIAPQAGCAPDVITSVEGKPVKSEEDLKAALSGAVHGVVQVEIVNGSAKFKLTERIERLRVQPK